MGRDLYFNIRKFGILIIFVFLQHFAVSAQTACINEGFDNGTTAPSGWIFTNIGDTYTTSSNYGDSLPSLKMDATNDIITTPLSSDTATELSFWIKGEGTDATSSLKIEGFNGTVWVTIATISPLPTTGTTFTYNTGTTPALPDGIKQFRFTYTKSVGNLSFDDVLVYCKTNSTPIPTTSTPPHMTSLLYDACATSCQEGKGEIAFANTGDYSVNVQTGNISLPYTVSTPYDLLGTIVDKPLKTDTINANAGCTLLIDAYNTTIPPHSRIILLPSDICTNGFGWDGLCANAPLYVLYGQSGTSGNTWHTGGNFGNNNNSLKTFNLNFKTTDGSTFDIGYSFDGGAGDGGYAVYGENPVGGHSISPRTLTNCRLDAGVLPVELISFTGESVNNQVDLQWKVASEHNNAYYTVKHSMDGVTFDEIGTVSGVGNSSSTLFYQLTDRHPKAGINYYQLFSTDYDGKTYNKGTISVSMNQESIFYNQITNQIVFPKSGNYSLINISGQKIAEIHQLSQYPFSERGLYFIQNEDSGIITKLVIP